MSEDPLSRNSVNLHANTEKKVFKLKKIILNRKEFKDDFLRFMHPESYTKSAEKATNRSM